MRKEYFFLCMSYVTVSKMSFHFIANSFDFQSSLEFAIIYK